MSRRSASAAVVLLLTLGACGGTAEPDTGTAPPNPSSAAGPEVRISAMTAYVALRSHVELGDGRLLSVQGTSTGDGLAASWVFQIASIQYNELLTYEVGKDGVIGKPKREAYNPVFDDRAPPFTEAAWTIDSPDAVRVLSSIAPVRRLFLESDDDGVLWWQISDAGGARTKVRAGTTPVTTPPPNTLLPRVRR